VDGTAAQPVVEVASVDSLELLGTVPAPRLNSIKVGEDFSFQTEEIPGTTFKASVGAVLPAVDPATNNGTVRIRITNTKHLLKVGEYLSVALPMRENGTQLVVPKQSVYPDESGEPHVYRVSGNEAESVAVQLGVQTSDSAEVLSGLTDGDTVIVNGGYGLPEKVTVRIKQ
jgi:RND family efflux transporter MFP subunit